MAQEIEVYTIQMTSKTNKNSIPDSGARGQSAYSLKLGADGKLHL